MEALRARKFLTSPLQQTINPQQQKPRAIRMKVPILLFHAADFRGPGTGFFVAVAGIKGVVVRLQGKMTLNPLNPFNPLNPPKTMTRLNLEDFANGQDVLVSRNSPR